MDEARVEALGAKPLMADIAAVAAIKDKTEMARFMGGTQGTFGSQPSSAAAPMPIPPIQRSMCCG